MLREANSPLRILAVDDDPMVCDSILMMLAYDGHKVMTAEDGEAALALLEQHSFDVVLLDYTMPGMKGDALAAAIKVRAPDLAVVMITAHGRLSANPFNLPAGVDYLLGKPFTLEGLRAAVAGALREKKPA